MVVANSGVIMVECPLISAVAVVGVEPSVVARSRWMYWVLAVGPVVITMSAGMTRSAYRRPAGMVTSSSSSAVSPAAAVIAVAGQAVAEVPGVKPRLMMPWGAAARALVT